MATDYTIPTYSRPDLGWDVPKYVKKYYDDLAAKKAEEESATVSEGAGVRSDQLYDSADPETRKAVGWGGGPFSQTEVSSGQGDPNVTRYDQWGNEVDMGNRTVGLGVMKIMEKLPQALIPGFGVVNAINKQLNKSGQKPASLLQTEAGTNVNLGGGGLLGNIGFEDIEEATRVGDYDPDFGFISP